MVKRKVMKKYEEDFKKLALAITLIITILLIGYFGYSMYNQYTEAKIQRSYLVSKKLVKKDYNIEEDLTELKNLTGERFIYISYTGNKDIYNLEKDLKKLIDEYNLKDKFYYVNIDSIKNDDNVISAINNLLGIDEGLVTKVPTIIYVNKNNEILRDNVITRLDDNLMEVGDFQKLLDINGF